MVISGSCKRAQYATCIFETIQNKQGGGDGNAPVPMFPFSKYNNRFLSKNQHISKYSLEGGWGLNIICLVCFVGPSE